MTVNVVWFKRDLRLADHEPLSDAAGEIEPTILLYVIEPVRLNQPDTDPTHIAWELDCANELDKSLRKIGGSLRIVHSNIIDCLKQYYDPQKDSWRGNSSTLLEFLKSRGVEEMATPTSIGRFLNQRIENGCKWVKSVGHREYEIKLVEGSTHELESKETEQTQDEIIEMSESDHDYDEDATYGRYNGTTN